MKFCIATRKVQQRPTRTAFLAFCGRRIHPNLSVTVTVKLSALALASLNYCWTPGVETHVRLTKERVPWDSYSKWRLKHRRNMRKLRTQQFALWPESPASCVLTVRTLWIYHHGHFRSNVAFIERELTGYRGGRLVFQAKAIDTDIKDNIKTSS